MPLTPSNSSCHHPHHPIGPLQKQPFSGKVTMIPPPPPPPPSSPPQFGDSGIYNHNKTPPAVRDAYEAAKARAARLKALLKPAG